MKIVIVDYGMGNIRSIVGALKHLGVNEISISSDFDGALGLGCGALVTGVSITNFASAFTEILLNGTIFFNRIG